MILFFAGSIACVNSFGPKNITLSTLDSTPLADGELIEILNVQITSPVRDDGFFIAGEDGGSNNALWVELASTAPDSIEMGDMIELTGQYRSHVTVTQQKRIHIIEKLVFGETDHLEVTDKNRMIPTTIFSIEDLSQNSLLEDLESVVIRVENIAMEETPTGWKVGNLWLNERYFSPQVNHLNASARALQGIFTLQNGTPEILPRNGDDMMGIQQSCKAHRCLSDLLPGELIFTEVMPNPDNAGRCGDHEGEYIEITYLPLDDQKKTVDLMGLIVTDSNSESLVRQSIVAEPFEPVWLSVGSQSCYGIPDAYLGSSIRLNNNGDELSLWIPSDNDQDWLMDSIEYSANQVKKGKSLQLDPLAFSNNQNDNPRHWCLEKSTIEMSQDFGSPGLENSGCY